MLTVARRQNTIMVVFVRIVTVYVQPATVLPILIVLAAMEHSLLNRIANRIAVLVLVPQGK